MLSVMTLTSVEQIHALAHPLRQSVLRMLATGPMTNKQLASAIGTSAGRLHFHVLELVKAGLIELEAERTKRGIVEKYYRASAAHYRVELPLNPQGSGQVSVAAASFEAAEQLYDMAMGHFGATPPGTLLIHEQAALTTEQVEAIHKHFLAIAEEMNVSARPSEARRTFVLTSLFHAVPPSSE